MSRPAVLREQGVLTDALPTLDRVDAALAALTGVLALEGRHRWVGDPDEGIILLPGPLPAGRQARHSAPVRAAVRPYQVDPSASTAVETASRICECGCGANVRARFLPGHDAKLKSRLIHQRAAGIRASTALTALGW